MNCAVAHCCWLVYFAYLDNELYMQISRSFRGNDQNMICRWTGSGMRSYRSSIRWNGSFSATMRAVIFNKVSGCRITSGRCGLCECRCVMNGHIWPDPVGTAPGWNNPWQHDILFSFFLFFRRNLKIEFFFFSCVSRTLYSFTLRFEFCVCFVRGCLWFYLETEFQLPLAVIVQRFCVLFLFLFATIHCRQNLHVIYCISVDMHWGIDNDTNENCVKCGVAAISGSLKE